MTYRIPDAVLAQHLAVLGKTGSGKTSTEKLAVEQVVAAGFRVCILDPIKSDWWGITSSADGKRPGLPFKILGGPHGHVPLHDSAGKAIGQLVGSGKLPLSIIDMADFGAGGLQKFFVDFAPALMRSARGVIYLVIEEAHEFAPKEMAGFGAEKLSIHWAKKLATAGRSKGIRLIVATQRTQSLHNAVLGSCETIIAHRLTTPADQKPVLHWLKANTNKETLERVAGSISSLPTGTGYVVSGEAQIFEQRAFPKFKTYDNAATPESDSDHIEVKTAPVDQDELRSIIGDAVKEAEENDPKLLKAEIAKLRKLATSNEVGKMNTPDPRDLEMAEHRGKEIALHAVAGLANDMVASLEQIEKSLAGTKRLLDSFAGFISTQAIAMPKPIRHPMAKTQVSYAKSMNGHGETMPGPQRKLLNVLAQFTQGRTKRQLAILAGYAHNGGAFNNPLANLRSKGWAEGGPDRIMITEAGCAALGKWGPLPQGDDLREYWFGNLAGPPSKLLRALCEAYPQGMSKDELAKACGYEPSGGAFNNPLARLRSLELVTGKGGAEIRASDDLFQ